MILAFVAALVALVLGPQVTLARPLGAPQGAAVERRGTGRLEAATVVAPARSADARVDHDSVDLVLAPVAGVARAVSSVLVAAEADQHDLPAVDPDARLARGPPSTD